MKCAALVRHGAWGPLETPRPCVRDARDGSQFCSFHTVLEQRKRAHVTTREGGYCVWCGNPGRVYENVKQRGVVIVLCGSCGEGLFRALEPHVRAQGRRRKAS